MQEHIIVIPWWLIVGIGIGFACCLIGEALPDIQRFIAKLRARKA